MVIRPFTENSAFDRGSQLTQGGKMRHLHVAVGDAKQVAILHRHEKLLEQPPRIGLGHAPLLHSTRKLHVSHCSEPWVLANKNSVTPY